MRKVGEQFAGADVSQFVAPDTMLIAADAEPAIQPTRDRATATLARFMSDPLVYSSGLRDKPAADTGICPPRPKPCSDLPIFLADPDFSIPARQ